MATKLAKGATKNLRDSNAKRLGVKASGGSLVTNGSILVRQRGTKVMAGDNVRTGKDHTLFAVVDGVVTYTDIKRKRFDGRIYSHKLVSVVEQATA